jgi:hypothetical protein
LQGVQGRYLFVGVAAIAATIGVALGGRESAGSTSQNSASKDSPTAPIDRFYALLPVLALVAAGLGLAAGISHFYVGNGFTGEVGTFSAWSPLRLRVLVPIGVLCAAAALAGAWIAMRAPRRPTNPDPA